MLADARYRFATGATVGMLVGGLLVTLFGGQARNIAGTSGSRIGPGTVRLASPPPTDGDLSDLAGTDDDEAAPTGRPASATPNGSVGRTDRNAPSAERDKAGGNGPVGNAGSSSPPAHRATTSQVKLGVLVTDTGGVGRLGFDLNTGDQREAFDAYLSDVNKRVASSGTIIKPVYVSYDPANASSMQSACIRLAQDEKVFAVLQTGGFTGPPVLCITEQFGLPFLAASSSEIGEYYTRSAGGYTTNPMTNERQLATLAVQLHRRDLLRGQTIGILDDQVGNDKVAVDRGLLPALSRLGYRVAHRETLSADPATASSQMPIAIRNMAAAGVNRLILAVNLIYAVQFVQAAEAQRFQPTYLVSDFRNLASDFAASNMSDSFFDNAVGFTSLRTGEALAGLPEPAVDAACRETWERATGKQLSRTASQYPSVMFACAVVMRFEAALTAIAGEPTRESFIKGTHALPAARLPFLGGTASFGARKWDGADFIRPVKPMKSCRCWIPNGTFEAGE